ncbi:MAG: zinc transporter ZupT [Paracoccaceae bacterium]|jgi:zinc transporter ZupT
MKQEIKLATAENIVTAICVGVGALLVVLALHTLSTVKSVNASNSYGYGAHSTLASFDNALTQKAGTFASEISEEK